TMAQRNTQIACFQEVPFKNGNITAWPYLPNLKWFYQPNQSNCQYSAILINDKTFPSILMSQYSNSWVTTVKTTFLKKELIIISAYFHGSEDIKGNLHFIDEIISGNPNCSLIMSI